MEKIKYPIGVQDFPELRESGAIYVDKTTYIRKMADTGSKRVQFNFRMHSLYIGLCHLQ